MGSTTHPGTTATPAELTAPASWSRIVAAATMLATVGCTLGSVVMLGVLYAKAMGWRGSLPLWEYMKLRDIAEELVLSLCMFSAYRAWPATSRTLRSKGGVLKVAIVFGTLALVATRVYYGAGQQRPALLALSFVVYVVFIALPIAWTFARMAPDAERESRAAANRLTDRELFQTILGLFLVVGSLHFMHWVTWSPAAGLLNLFGLFVIPAAAVVLGVGARKVMAGVSKVLEEEPPAWLLSVVAVIIGWAAVIYYFMFAHAPHSP